MSVKTDSGKLVGNSLDLEQIAAIFDEAAEVDPTLVVTPGLLKKLAEKYVHPTRYSRKQWLSDMVNGEMSLFDTYPTPSSETKNSKGGTAKAKQADFLKRLAKWNPDRTFHVQTGRSATIKYLSFAEIYRRWSGNRAVVSATDIHLRKTTVSRLLDMEALTHLNLLPYADEEARSLEMLAMVISTRHNLTDSHSDDMDGSNYCFCGKKLWLAWDTHEGHVKGLEDCDRDHVSGNAAFDMKTFLSLKSAKWFLVSDGQMLFLPGNYAHKVFTIERYIGVGGFYITLPNTLRTVSRWETMGANWETGVGDISESLETEQVVDVVEHTLQMESRLRRKELGEDLVKPALEIWRQSPAAKRKGDTPATDKLVSLMG